MFKTYDLFDHRNINDLVPEIVYYYLFQGLSLTAIEEKLFKTEDYHGWLSKTFLNYYGINTEKENKGIYADRTVPEVVEELYSSSNIAHVRVAKLLKEKYLLYYSCQMIKSLPICFSNENIYTMCIIKALLYLRGEKT